MRAIMNVESESRTNVALAKDESSKASDLVMLKVTDKNIVSFVQFTPSERLKDAGEGDSVVLLVSNISWGKLLFVALSIAAFEVISVMGSTYDNTFHSFIIRINL